MRSYEPWVARRQAEYVNEALSTNMLSWRGQYGDRFEEALADYHGVRHCILTSSGTTALWALYHALGLYGRHVVTSTMTYAATVNQLHMVGAHVWLVDCDDHLQMDLNQLEETLREVRRVHGKGSATVVVPNIYADCPDMDHLTAVCARYWATLVEDNAEGAFCFVGTRPLGTFGVASTLSFFANKIITSGEGGAVLTDDRGLADRLRLFINHNTQPGYVHTGASCSNLRMSNLQAAVGLAQFEDLGDILTAKRRQFRLYEERLGDRMVRPHRVTSSSHWLPVVRGDYKQLVGPAREAGVEIRPLFWPIHLQPDWPEYGTVGDLSNSERLLDEYLCVPGGPALTDDDVQRVCDAIS